MARARDIGVLRTMAVCLLKNNNSSKIEGLLGRQVTESPNQALFAAGLPFLLLDCKAKAGVKGACVSHASVLVHMPGRMSRARHVTRDKRRVGERDRGGEGEREREEESARKRETRPGAASARASRAGRRTCSRQVMASGVDGSGGTKTYTPV